jgi:uncharacterized protein (TIGR04255 family)
VASPVEVAVPGRDALRGTLVDIDTIQSLAEDPWGVLEKGLDRAHDAAKRLFFDLLTEDAIERLGPVYE